MKAKQTRFPGVASYATKSGERFRWWLTHPIDPNNPQGMSKRTTRGGFVSAKEADAHRRRWYTHFEETGGEVEVLGEVTFENYAMNWMRLAKPNRQNTTMDGYEKILRNHLFPAIGHLPLTEITEDILRDHYAALRANGRKDERNPGGPLGANSLSKVHGLLRLVLDDAVEGKKLKVNPASRSKYLQVPTKKQIRGEKPETRVWTVEETQAFLSWNKNVKNDDLHLLWRVLVVTGMRRSEAVALQWRDFNFETSQIHVQRSADAARSRQLKKTKSFRERFIELDQETIEELKNWKQIRAQLGEVFVLPDSFVFGTYSNQLRIPNDISARWRRLIVKARAELGHELQSRVKLHELRHTHATQLQDLGVDLDVLQQRLGHSEISTTVDIYTHGGRKMQSMAVKKLSEKYLSIAHESAHDNSEKTS